MSQTIVFGGKDPRIQSVTFGEKNTWDHWKILPTSRPIISPPEPKTNYIDLPGSNGSIDLSQSLTKYPVFSNREGAINFRVMNGYGEWHKRYSDIMAYLHGKAMRMILFDDPDWFYDGRYSVSEWSSGNTWSEISIKYNTSPFKWSVYSPAEPWLWDTFNFDSDKIMWDVFTNIIITDPNNWKTFEFPGGIFGDAPISVKAYVCNASNLEVNFINTYLNINHTQPLKSGLNRIPDMIFYGASKYVIRFRGISGRIDLDFRVGRL